MALSALGTGCASVGGSDVRAEDLPSKAELQKQIDDVTANPNIAPNAKSMIIAGLTKKKDRATK